MLIADDYDPSSSAPSSSTDAWGAPADPSTSPFEQPPTDAFSTSLDADADAPTTDGERRRRAALAEEAAESSSSATGPPRAASYAFAALNVITSCAAVAIAKQMMNPQNLRSAAAAADPHPHPSPPPPPTDVPPWFRDTYKQWAAGEAGRAAVRRVARDTAVLAGASVVWYGAELGLKTARGGKDDALNPAVAGGLGAGLIGLGFFGDAAGAASASTSAAVRDALRRRVLVRSGLWAGAGASLGAWGWGEAQRARGAMLRRQQELERKHLGTSEGEVAESLDGRLLRKLARMEEAERQRLRLQQAQQAAAATGGGVVPVGEGVPRAVAVALGPPPPGGYTREEEEVRWRQLMDNPPWVGQGAGAEARAAGGGGGDQR